MFARGGLRRTLGASYHKRPSRIKVRAVRVVS